MHPIVASAPAFTRLAIRSTTMPQLPVSAFDDPTLFDSSAREVISRTLSEFQRRGWIEQARGEVRLMDRPALEKLTREPEV